MHIFISYARKDGDRVSPIRVALEAAGYATWIDHQRILPGNNWSSTIEDAIAVCSLFLVALTPDAVQSEHVRDECAYAMACHKDIVPLMLEQTLPFLDLIRKQYIDFVVDYEQGLAHLLQCLRLYAIPLALPVALETQVFPPDPKEMKDE